MPVNITRLTGGAQGFKVSFLQGFTFQAEISLACCNVDTVSTA